MPTFRTLNPHKHRVILAGNFTNYGIANIANGITYTTAVYGPAAGNFDVINTGKISDYGYSDLTSVSTGLLLASPGTVNNLGTIEAEQGTGILLQSTTAGSRVINSGYAYGDVGIQLNGAGVVDNSGFIRAHQTGIDLSSGGQILNRGTIDTNYGAGIYEYNASLSTTIDNTGQIDGRNGIFLNGQSNVQNGPSGTISASSYGVNSLQIGYLYNKGVISGNRFAAWLHDGGTVITSGTLLGSYGIYSSTGPVYVTNLGYIHAQSMGIRGGDGGLFRNFGTIIGGWGISVSYSALAQNEIKNYGLISATSAFAVYFEGVGVLENRGTITGPNTSVVFGSGGDLTNYGTITSAAAGVSNGNAFFVASNLGSIMAAGNGIQSYAASNIYNKGFIGGSQGAARGGQGLSLLDGNAYVRNAGTIFGEYGMVFDTGTVVNETLGVILATYAGISLNGTGLIDNEGRISGSAGVDVNGAVVMNNISTITGSTDDGVLINASGPATTDVRNYGHIYSTAANGVEIYTYYGGVISNVGFIRGGKSGVFLHGAGTIINSGQITGEQYGVVLGSAAYGTPSTDTLFNSGNIYAGYDGVLAASGATITDYGKINGTGGYAILFNAYYSNRLIINAAAKFQGAVYGGNGALEFAADGTTIGTFSAAEQTTFNGFNSFQIDSGATWDLLGKFTLNSAAPLLNNGTIIESASDTLTIDAAVAGSGTIALSKKPLTINGSVTNTQHILFTNGGEDLVLGDANVFKGKIEKFALNDTIDLAHVPLSAITATHFIAGVLTLSEGTTKLEFTFASPANFGGDTFKVSALGDGTAITLAPAAALLPVSPLSTPSPFITLGN